MSLVEVLVAALVLTIGILGILVAFPQSLLGARKSGRALILGRIATEQLESLRALPFDDTDLSPGIHPSQQLDSTGNGYYPVAGFDERYSVRWTVEAGPTDGDGNVVPLMKTVSVEATYRVRYTPSGDPVAQEGSLESRFRTLFTRVH